MTAIVKGRYCRCGTRLARDNPGARCAACVAGERVRPDGAPDVPSDYWDEPVLRDALQGRHMGRVIRAWRTHPYHGRRPFAQDRVASWMGITQAQLSRIENGPALAHLDRLVQWARVLRIPQERLWFTLPPLTWEQHHAGGRGDAGEQRSGHQRATRKLGSQGAARRVRADEAQRNAARRDEATVNRRGFLAAAGLGAAGLGAAGLGLAGAAMPAAPSGLGGSDGHHAVEWLAWRLWQDRTERVHESTVPAAIAASLAGHALVTQDVDGWYGLRDPSMVDVLVARWVFVDIEAGSTHLLASAQTSHATDLALGALTAENTKAQRALMAWMQRGTSPVLRVNAAGVLAKVGSPDLGDAAILSIRDDPDSRQLYLAAVMSRVLSLPFEEAAHSVRDGHVRFRDGQVAWAVDRLVHEVTNPRDAVARWCGAVLLYEIAPVGSEAARTGLVRALRQESCRENLRAYAAVLGRADPLSM